MVLWDCLNEQNLSTEPGRATERNACKLQQRPLPARRSRSCPSCTKDSVFFVIRRCANQSQTSSSTATAIESQVAVDSIRKYCLWSRSQWSHAATFTLRQRETKCMANMCPRITTANILDGSLYSPSKATIF